MLERPWIAHRQPPARAWARLLCLPFAGGGASIYRTWAAEFPPSIDVCPIELPGRETRFSEPPYSRIERLVEDLANVITEAGRDLPLSLFGHSMGATIAFELARVLELRGIVPAHVFVSARRAPHLPVRAEHAEPIASMSDERLVARLRELAGTPPAVLENEELAELVVEIVRADFAMVEAHAYVEGAPVSCPITAFGGLSDEYVSRDELAAWAEHTSSAFTVRMLAGDHFFLQQPAAKRLVCHEIARSMLVGPTRTRSSG